MWIAVALDKIVVDAYEVGCVGERKREREEVLGQALFVKTVAMPTYGGAFNSVWFILALFL